MLFYCAAKAKRINTNYLPGGKTTCVLKHEVVGQCLFVLLFYTLLNAPVLFTFVIYNINMHTLNARYCLYIKSVLYVAVILLLAVWAFFLLNGFGFCPGGALPSLAVRDVHLFFTYTSRIVSANTEFRDSALCLAHLR